MKTTLLIMAAGIGSRFGTGIKQLEPVDDANHIIMDYSIHDAIEAGFNHVVFIIRKDIEKEFKEAASGKYIGTYTKTWSVSSNMTVTIRPSYSVIVNKVTSTKVRLQLEKLGVNAYYYMKKCLESS